MPEFHTYVLWGYPDLDLIFLKKIVSRISSLLVLNPAYMLHGRKDFKFLRIERGMIELRQVHWADHSHEEFMINLSFQNPTVLFKLRTPGEWSKTFADGRMVSVVFENKK